MTNSDANEPFSRPSNASKPMMEIQLLLLANLHFAFEKSTKWGETAFFILLVIVCISGFWSLINRKK